MPPTFDQFDALAGALCGILRSPGANPPQPFSIDVHPSMLPDQIISGLAPPQGWAALAGGPGGKDIRLGRLYVVVDGRQCFFSMSVEGYMTTPDGNLQLFRRATPWFPVT
jgi:hypothetical protein